MISKDEVQQAIHQEPMDLDTITKYLQEEREQLEEEISNLHQQDPFSQEETRGVDESIEDAYEVSEHLQVDAIAKKVKDSLQQVSDALEKIHEGMYGICRNCNEPIGKARLAALPEATECLRCERQDE